MWLKWMIDNGGEQFFNTVTIIRSTNNGLSFPKFIGSTAGFLLSRSNVYLNTMGKYQRWMKDEVNNWMMQHQISGIVFSFKNNFTLLFLKQQFFATAALADYFLNWKQFYQQINLILRQTRTFIRLTQICWIDISSEHLQFIDKTIIDVHIQLITSNNANIQ